MTRIIFITFCFNLLLLGHGDTSADSGVSISRDSVLTAYSLAGEQDDTSGRINAAIYLGKICIKQNDYDEAKRYLSEALELSNTAGNDYYKAQSLSYLGQLYFLINDYQSSVKCLKENISLIETAPDFSLKDHTYYFLAASYNKLGMRKEALDYAFEILKRNNPEPVYLCRVYTLLAIIYNDIGEIEKAMKHFAKALKLSEELGEWKIAVRNYVRFASYYNSYGYFEKACEYYIKAIDMCKRYDYEPELGYAYMNFGDIYFSHGDFNEAMEKYRIALKYFRNTKDDHYLAFTNNNIGEIYVNTSVLDSAKIYVEKALTHGVLSQNRISLGCSYHSLGKIAMLEKDYGSAIRYFKRSLEEEYIGTTEQNYFQLSNVYEILNRQDSALVYLRLRDELKDSVFNVNAQKLFVDTGLKYEIETKEKELSHVKDENKSLVQKVENSQNMSAFLILGGFVIIGFVVFHYRNKTMEVIQKIKPLSIKTIDDRRKYKRVIRAIDEISSTEARKVMDDKLVKEIMEKLDWLMSEDKIYTNPQLTQQKVAEMLNTNTAYISRAINIYSNSNFSSYINRFRIEEAKRNIAEDKEGLYTFEGIANSVGFSSKSAFYASFKKNTGKTPSQYAKELSENRDCFGSDL